MTRDNSRELLKKAFIDAMCEKYEKELSVCSETADCSAAHKKRIKQIICGSTAVVPRKRLSKRTVIALLIAAALLLAGCTVYAYRDTIGNFFVEIFGEYMVGQFDNGKEENLSEIKDIYTVGYIPEGYTLQKGMIRGSVVTYTWQNDSGDLISFEQKIYDKTKHYIDGETIQFSELLIEDYIVYFANVDSSYLLLWDNGKYIFTLRTTHRFSEEVITKLIKSITEKQ